MLRIKMNKILIILILYFYYSYSKEYGALSQVKPMLRRYYVTLKGGSPQYQPI